MGWAKATAWWDENHSSFDFGCVLYSRVTLYTAGHMHTAVPHCSHSRAPIVHTAVPRENNEHGCVYLRCRAVCKLPGCVEGHPWYWRFYGTWTYLVFSGGFTSAFQKYGRDWRARSVEELHSNLSNKRKTELRNCFMGVFDWSITDNKKIVTSFCGIHSRLEYSYLFYWGL